MKYLIIIMFLFCNIFIFSQDIKQFKNTTNIEINIRYEKIININDAKIIKLIYKQLNRIDYNPLDNPQSWFRSHNWQMILTFDNEKENIIFYSGGFITIGEKSYYTSIEEIEKLKKLVKS